jgi:hypothetical protein
MYVTLCMIDIRNCDKSLKVEVMRKKFWFDRVIHLKSTGMKTIMLVFEFGLNQRESEKKISKLKSRNNFMLSTVRQSTLLLNRPE